MPPMPPTLSMIGVMASPLRLHRTVPVRVGHVQVGGGAPVVVQSMTMTETADAKATAPQCIELAGAGSEMVRVTVNTPEAAGAVAGDQATDARRRLRRRRSSAIFTTTAICC